MSFGWSAGDIFAAVRLLVEIGQALREANGSPKDHQRANDLVTPIKNGLAQLQKYVKEDEEGISSLDKEKTSNFSPTVEALRPLIEQFTEKVLQYSGLSEAGPKNAPPAEVVKKIRDWAKRQYNKLAWHFVEKEDLLHLRQTIEAHFTILSAVYPEMIM